MVIWTVLSWIMSAVALFGTILNAERNIYGFVFWLVSNLYMTVRFTYIGEYPQALLFLIYTILAVRGLVAWRSKEIQARRKMNDDEVLKKLEVLKLRLQELNEGNKK